MIDDIKKIIEKIENLSEKDQKHIADLIMDEINWLESFQKSESNLSNHINEALMEYMARKN
jgi:hypothetical protein